LRDPTVVVVVVAVDLIRTGLEIGRFSDEM
jgi:hypothetical protein